LRINNSALDVSKEHLDQVEKFQKTTWSSGARESTTLPSVFCDGLVSEEVSEENPAPGFGIKNTK